MEIERKYLVLDDSFKQLATEVLPIEQGYVCRDQLHTVRARVKGDHGYLTIKGKSLDGGLSRFEWEREIPVSDARLLLSRSILGRVSKTRYLVPWQEVVIEVDVFEGENTGLVMAEIELQSVDQVVDSLPSFLGQEVTGDIRYYNSYLANHPFSKW